MSGSVTKLGFVLLGKTGEGKSAFGNFLLRKNAFISGLNASSVSTEPKSDFVKLGSIWVTVVDNPGLYSEDLAMLSTAMAIQDSIEKVGHDNFVFLLVIRLGRYKAEDNDTMNFLTIMFGRELMQHTIIIFTHEDQAANDGQNISSLIQDFFSMPKRKELFDRCSQKYLCVNSYERNEEIQKSKWNQLLQMVMTITDNGQKWYRKDDLHVYKDALRTHAHLCSKKRLSAEEMQAIMHTQIDNLKRKTEDKDAKIERLEKTIHRCKVGAAVVGGIALGASGGALLGVGACALGSAIASISVGTAAPAAAGTATAIAGPGLYFILTR